MTPGDGIGARLPLVMVAFVLCAALAGAFRGCRGAERAALPHAVRPDPGAPTAELAGDAATLAPPAAPDAPPPASGPLTASDHGPAAGVEPVRAEHARSGRPFAFRGPPCVSVGGVLEEPNGAPLADVVMAAQLQDELSSGEAELAHPTMSTRTDENGRFELELDAPGTWTVGVDPAAAAGVLALGPGSRFTRECGTGSFTVLRAVRIPSASELGRFLRARVETFDGEPVVGAWVRADAADAVGIRTGARSVWNGDVIIGPVDPGEWLLQTVPVRGAGHYTESDLVRVVTGGRPATLRVAPAARLRVRLAGASHEQPLVHLVVASGRAIVRSVETAGTAIELEGLGQGPYSLVATTADGLIGFARGLELDEAENESSILLRSGRTLDVRFVGAAHPVALGAVDLGERLVALRGAIVAPTLSLVVPAGPLKLWAQDADGRRCERTIGGAADVEIDVAF